MTSIPPSSRRYVQTVPFKPTPGWMLSRLARIVAFGFGLGLLKPAPGTWGTLGAWLLWWAGIGHFAPWGMALLLALGFAYGVWACGAVGREMGAPDHGGMVWDEMIAFWLVLWLVPADLFAQSLVFVLFRMFDILKPPPVSWLDQRFKSGFGVMIDDIVAALYTLIVYAIIAAVAG